MIQKIKPVFVGIIIVLCAESLCCYNAMPVRIRKIFDSTVGGHLLSLLVLVSCPATLPLMLVILMVTKQMSSGRKSNAGNNVEGYSRTPMFLVLLLLVKRADKQRVLDDLEENWISMDEKFGRRCANLDLWKHVLMSYGPFAWSAIKRFGAGALGKFGIQAAMQAVKKNIG